METPPPAAAPATESADDTVEGTGDAAEEEEVEAVEGLIEGLNAAIDNVNVLEDEFQALLARHSTARVELRCLTQILEAESGSGAWSAHATAVVDACQAAARARQQVAPAQQQLVRLQADQLRVQKELQLAAAAGDLGLRMALTSQAAALRNATVAPNRALASARKAVNNAASKEEKARRQLQRAYAHESARAASSGAVHLLPPLGEELGLLERRVQLISEVEGLSTEQDGEKVEMEMRKEEAAAKVSEAMQALEEMSNAIHERRVNAAAADAGSRGGAEGGASAVDGDGTASAAGPRAPADVRTAAEDGGDSDFVLDSGESSGDEGTSGEAVGRIQAATHQQKGRHGAHRPFVVGSGADEAYVATRAAVARLLRRAGDLMNSVAPPKPTEPPPWHAHRVDSDWFGIAWTDPPSLAQLRAESSIICTQVI
jgi:hypothetical protein